MVFYGGEKSCVTPTAILYRSLTLTIYIRGVVFCGGCAIVGMCIMYFYVATVHTAVLSSAYSTSTRKLSAPRAIPESANKHRTLSARFSAVIPIGSPACESVSPAHRLSSIFRPLPRATPHLWFRLVSFAQREAHVLGLSSTYRPTSGSMVVHRTSCVLRLCRFLN